MIKSIRIVCLLVAGVATTSCATNVSEVVKSVVETAPDWYEERRTEVAGEGYPDVRKVPVAPEKVISVKDVQEATEDLLSEAEKLEADPMATSPAEEDREDPATWAARIRAEIAEGESS